MGLEDDLEILTNRLIQRKKISEFNRKFQEMQFHGKKIAPILIMSGLLGGLVLSGVLFSKSIYKFLHFGEHHDSSQNSSLEIESVNYKNRAKQALSKYYKTKDTPNYDIGIYHKADFALGKWLQHDVTDPEPRYLIAKLQMSIEYYREAPHYLQEALKLDPNNKEYKELLIEAQKEYSKRF